jgi:hypothetical protein
MLKLIRALNATRENKNFLNTRRRVGAHEESNVL